MQIRDLRVLTGVLTIMVVIDAVWTPVVLTTALVAPAMFQAIVTPVASSVDLAAGLFKITTMIVFACWIYVAGRNLLAADFNDLEFTPASRIWWFAVPIASLFKPFQGMRELWNASRGVSAYETNDSLVSGWWALWLLNNLGSFFIGFASGAANMANVGMWVASVIDLALAVFAIMLIRGIALAQQGLSGENLAEVFA